MEYHQEITFPRRRVVLHWGMKPASRELVNYPTGWWAIKEIE